MSRRLLNCESGLKDMSHGWQVMVWSDGDVVSHGERKPEDRWANSRDSKVEIVSADERGRATPGLLNCVERGKELRRTRERQ